MEEAGRQPERPFRHIISMAEKAPARMGKTGRGAGKSLFGNTK